MRRLPFPAALLILLGMVAAGCGGGGGGAAATSGNATVSLRQIDGVGSVLVDSHGAALYSPEQEASGMIRCSGACAKIWIPLGPGGAKPTAGTGVTGKLDRTMRPDGTWQVTYDGRPLYTFAEDGGSGKVTGNGVSDSFGSKHFTWHAVTAKGAAPAASSKPGQKSGSYSY
jgi:predicted lipoprotein with Yx(FWY)xxD motif